MLSSRPYLLRAIHEWIVDSGMTPHVLADAAQPGVEVPSTAVQDGKVVLNIGPSAVRDLIIDNELLTFVARFGGVSRAIAVPISAVLAVYARENGRGMMFPEEDGDGADGLDSDDDQPARPGRPTLKVIK